MLQYIRKQFKNKTFAANVMTLTVGTVIAQLIPVLLQPVLRRLFAPEEFGLFSVYMSIVSITTIFYSLRYAQTINIPKNDIEAKNIFSLSIVLSFIFTIILFLIIVLFEFRILKILNIPIGKKYYLYLAPISSLLFSVFHIINFWLIRKKEFRLSSLNKIFRRSAEGGVHIFTGLTGKSVGLVLGDLLGNIANIVSGTHKLRKINFNFTGVTPDRIKYVFRRYVDMPKYNVFPAFLNSLSLYLPAIFINKFYSPLVAGEFHLTNLILNVPIVFVGKSISTVLIQRLSEKRQNKVKMWPEMKKLTVLLLAIGIIMGIVIWSIGPWLFRIVFGAEWQVSGEYAQIFVLLAIVRLVASPFNVAFIILERVRLFAIWQIFYFLGIVTLSLFSFLSFNSFLWLLVGIGCFFYLINIFLIYKIIIKQDSLIII
ncbi:MAG: lipopolysaccharide biosynthesis protein [Thiohalospira sp.]